MTDAPKDREEQFFAVVLPRLKAAGYDGYGSQARLSEATGMSPGTASRLVRGKTIPDIPFFPALAKIIGMSPLELLVLAGVFPTDALQSQQTLSETNQSRVGSEGLTPERVADELGFHDEVRRAVFLGVVESLKNSQEEDDHASDDSGGTAAQM
jgi:transcriptional regulator with XRE-family HTH domain